MGEKIIGLRQQLHFLERREKEREVGYRFVTRDTEKRLRDSVPRVEVATVDFVVVIVVVDAV